MVGTDWYSIWAMSGMSPALPAVSSLDSSASPPAASVNLICMFGCDWFQTATTLSMWGTQDQKVSVTFSFGSAVLPAPLGLLEEEQPATSAVAARAHAAAFAERGNFIVHSCRCEAEG